MTTEKFLNEPEDDDTELLPVDGYTPLLTEEAEREVELPEHNGHKSMMEAEEESPNQSDLQTVLHRLFPIFSNKEINQMGQSIMMARIAPDVFLDLIFCTVDSILENHNPTENIDVQATFNLVYSIFSIGLDGKGRFDALELAGAVKEEEMEQLSSQLGFGGR